MFSQAWFWLLFASFFFNTYYTLACNSIGKSVGKVSLGTTLGQIVFLVLGFFCANNWWEPLAAIASCYIGGGLLGVFIPERAKMIIGMIGKILAPILLIAAYFVWY